MVQLVKCVALSVFILMSSNSSTLSQDRQRKTPYVTNSIVVVSGGCRDEESIRIISEASKISNEAIKLVGADLPCVSFLPRPVTLRKFLFEFVDYEHDILEVWEVSTFAPHHEVFYVWLISPKRQTRL